MYDVAIIGSGPAGISAAINLKILNKNFIWLSSRAVSKKVGQAPLIKNYPGLPDVTGGELAWTFKNHIERMNIKLEEKVVTGVYDTGGKFTLLAGEEQYEAKTVIICSGTETVKSLEGEESFVGRGVSYCATCDGFLYRDKTIAVLCTDKKFEHEVEFLADLSKKAYVFPMYQGYDIKSEKAEILLKNPVKITGGQKIEKVHFKGGEVAVDGLFILKGVISPSTLV
ncbi:MAG: NAD(P)/FAD-dependent oxidoreductase, partial [Clostridia bacterium]|nr:NAD(P)/FAD-dependent oxidoreductase [Clostridia bacterium]